jgi:hypothetical protein
MAQQEKQDKGVADTALALKPKTDPEAHKITDADREVMKMMDRGIALNTFAELVNFAEYIAESNLVPKDFKNKPADIVIAVEWGREIGLSTMQSLAHIAVINGRATVWGDAVPGLCLASGLCEYIMVPSLKEIREAGACEVRVKRRGHPEVVGYYDKAMAQQAGLWGKEGPWRTNPERMMLNRARTFGCRDAFADVLKGLHVAEDFDDGAPEPRKEPRDITPRRKLKEVKRDGKPALPEPGALDDPNAQPSGAQDAATNGEPQDAGDDAREHEEGDANGDGAVYVEPVAPSEPTEACQTQVKLTGGTYFTAGITGITLAKVQIAVRKFDAKIYVGAALDALGNVTANLGIGDRVDWFHLSEQEGKQFLQYLNANIGS